METSTVNSIKYEWNISTPCSNAQPASQNSQGRNQFSFTPINSSSNTTPISWTISNSSNPHNNTARKMSVADLDLIQRQRREEAFQQRLSTQDSLLKDSHDKFLFITSWQNESTFSINDHERKIKPMPRLDYRPETRDHISYSPALIPVGDLNNGQPMCANTHDIFNSLFQSPHSDRFVLKFPNCDQSTDESTTLCLNEDEMDLIEDTNGSAQLSDNDSPLSSSNEDSRKPTGVSDQSHRTFKKIISLKPKQSRTQSATMMLPHVQNMTCPPHLPFSPDLTEDHEFQRPSKRAASFGSSSNFFHQDDLSHIETPKMGSFTTPRPHTRKHSLRSTTEFSSNYHHPQQHVSSYITQPFHSPHTRISRSHSLGCDSIGSAIETLTPLSESHYLTPVPGAPQSHHMLAYNHYHSYNPTSHAVISHNGGGNTSAVNINNNTNNISNNGNTNHPHSQNRMLETPQNNYIPSLLNSFDSNDLRDRRGSIRSVFIPSLYPTTPTVK